MRTLVVLAVMGLCSALPQQAYNPPSQSYGVPQVEYSGPLASSEPAGVNGQVVPVADTYEVAAAKNSFFDAYQRQLSAVESARRYSDSPVHHTVPAPLYRSAPAPVYNSAPAPAYAPTPAYIPAVPAPSYTQAAPAPSYSPAAAATIVVSNGHVQDTPEVSAAKSQFYQLYNQQAAAADAAPDVHIYDDEYHPTYQYAG